MSFLHWRTLFLMMAAVATAPLLSMRGAAEEGAPEKAPDSEPPYYWTFPVLRDLMDVLPPEHPEEIADPFGDPSVQFRRPLRRFTTWKEHPDFFEVGAIQDASRLLVEAGIPWRKGQDLAFFHQADAVLYVRAPRPAVDLTNEFLGSFSIDPRRVIEVEVLIVGLDGPRVWNALDAADDPRAFAEALQAPDGAIIARASVVTRSGQRAFLGQTGPEAGGADPKQTETQSSMPQHALPHDAKAPGLRFEAEPTLGPDGWTIDLSCSGSFVLPSAGAAAGEFSTLLTVTSGHGALQRLSLEGSTWKEAAILFHAVVRDVSRVTWIDGQRSLTPREVLWRKFNQQPKQDTGK